MNVRKAELKMMKELLDMLIENMQMIKNMLSYLIEDSAEKEFDLSEVPTSELLEEICYRCPEDGSGKKECDPCDEWSDV